MKKFKFLFSNNVKYFIILSVLCFSLVAVFRPIVQNNLDSVIVSTQPQPAKKNLPIYCVDTDEKKVAISFDAAWGADDTDELLTILENNDAKATFFLCGYWVDKYPEEVKRIYEAGHEIGNHSNTHPHGSQISLEQNKNEIMEVHKKVKDLLGYDMDLYRPPFGEYNDTVLQAAKEVGYHTIQWDIETLDIRIEKCNKIKIPPYIILIRRYFLCKYIIKSLCVDIAFLTCLPLKLNLMLFPYKIFVFLLRYRMLGVNLLFCKFF